MRDDTHYNHDHDSDSGRYKYGGETRIAWCLARRGRQHSATKKREHSPTLTEVRPSSSEARLPFAPPPALLLTLMRLLLLGAGRTMALNGRCGRVPGEAGGELAIFPGGESGGLGLCMGWCSALVLSAQQPLGGRPGLASSCQPEFHTHHSGTKGPPAESRQPHTPRQFLSRLAGRVRRRGEARRDQRGETGSSGFRVSQAMELFFLFSGDSECYGGWPQASYSIRIDRGLAVVLLVARVYFGGRGLWLGRPSGGRRLGDVPLFI